MTVKTQAAVKSAGWQGSDCMRRIKTTNEQTAEERPVKESQTVPYYSIFQQLVICLISLLESNGIIIKTQTERQTDEEEEVSVVFFFFFLTYGFKAVRQKRFHTWQPLRNVSLFLT